jgi:hypothetical protein
LFTFDEAHANLKKILTFDEATLNLGFDLQINGGSMGFFGVDGNFEGL